LKEHSRVLTEKDYGVHGITESDFDHSISSVKEMIDTRSEQYQRKAQNIREINDEEIANDFFDDVSYYIYTDTQYLWQFTLWRLQGLIEAIITYQLMVSKKLFALESKLEARKKNDYDIEKEEINELVLWANLRNIILHAPPEQYRLTPIIGENIIYYYQFIKKTIY